MRRERVGGSFRKFRTLNTDAERAVGHSFFGAGTIEVSQGAVIGEGIVERQGNSGCCFDDNAAVRVWVDRKLGFCALVDPLLVLPAGQCKAPRHQHTCNSLSRHSNKKAPIGWTEQIGRCPTDHCASLFIFVVRHVFYLRFRVVQGQFCFDLGCLMGW